MRESNGWSNPEPLDLSIPSSLLLGWQFYVVRNRTIYLELWGSDGSPPDIYKMKLEDGRYQTPVSIDVVNTEYNEFSPYVDPEEKFMIFVSNRPGVTLSSFKFSVLFNIFIFLKAALCMSIGNFFV
jgi:hypothetical protein